MSSKPPSCSGCPLAQLGQGFTQLEGTGRNSVLIVNEALDERGLLVGRAGFLFENLLQRAGLERDAFWITNAINCKPPDYKIEGTDYEYRALAHCKRHHLLPLLEKLKPKVIVPLGNPALFSLMGVKGFMEMRGYPEWDSSLSAWILPTVHPNYIMRGNTNFGGVFIHDIQKACEIAEHGWKAADTSGYLLDPDPKGAQEFASEYYALEQEHREGVQRGQPPIRLSYDIETPIKGEDESESDADDESYQIDRIGFAYAPGEALSVPWNADYLPTIRNLLGSPGEKVVWNAGFDNSRIRANAVPIHGLIHDGMVAWHVLNSDLPKKLGFVATFLVPDQPRWKHLSGSQPAYYNAIDADVELRAMLECERLLKQTHMWDPVYDLQVLKLDPVLSYMSEQGMPIDHAKRLDYATELASRLAAVNAKMVEAVPLPARIIKHVYKTTPKDTTGLLSRPGLRSVRVCSVCGVRQPTASHFKRYVRKVNPCAGGSALVSEVACDEWYRLADFTSSPKQILNYQKVLGHKAIMTGKAGVKRATTDEKAIKQLMAKYGDDKLYPLILERRELDKVAGTYIGRVEEVA